MRAGLGGSIQAGAVHRSGPMQAEEGRAEIVPVGTMAVARGRDRVAVAAIAMDHRSGLGGHLRQPFAQAQVLQHPRRVSRKSYGSADLAQLSRLLQDLSDDAPTAQQQRERAPPRPRLR